MMMAKNNILIVALLILILIGGGVYLRQNNESTPAQSESSIASNASGALKTVLDVANEISGITSGAVFNFEVTSIDGKFANFGVLRYKDEVRGDSVVDEHSVVFREIGGSGMAEVGRDTNKVVSFRRNVPSFVGGEYPADEIESRARQFLTRIYPEFQNLESSLTFSPGMKGVRLNNGNYFYRWDDTSYKLPEGLSMEVAPHLQVGVTSSGFIFAYENTLQLYRALSQSDFSQ